MQINYIESNDGKVPFILTGYKDKMDELLQKYQLKIVEEGENITYIANSSLNKQIVKAIISKSELRRIINQSEISEFTPYTTYFMKELNPTYIIFFYGRVESSI